MFHLCFIAMVVFSLKVYSYMYKYRRCRSTHRRPDQHRRTCFAVLGFFFFLGALSSGSTQAGSLPYLSTRDCHETYRTHMYNSALAIFNPDVCHLESGGSGERHGAGGNLNAPRFSEIFEKTHRTFEWLSCAKRYKYASKETGTGLAPCPRTVSKKNTLLNDVWYVQQYGCVCRRLPSTRTDMFCDVKKPNCNRSAFQSLSRRARVFSPLPKEGVTMSETRSSVARGK